MMVIYIIILIILVIISLVVGINLSLTARRGDAMTKKALDEFDSKEKTDLNVKRVDDVT